MPLLDIHNILLVVELFAHRTQELLELLAAVLAHLALKLVERLMDRFRLGHGMLDLGLEPCGGSTIDSR
jgi:hypothetical protein